MLGFSGEFNCATEKGAMVLVYVSAEDSDIEDSPQYWISITTDYPHLS